MTRQDREREANLKLLTHDLAMYVYVCWTVYSMNGCCCFYIIVCVCVCMCMCVCLLLHLCTMSSSSRFSD